MLSVYISRYTRKHTRLHLNVHSRMASKMPTWYGERISGKMKNEVTYLQETTEAEWQILKRIGI